VPQQTVTRKLEELPTKFPGTNRAKLSEYVLPWLDGDARGAPRGRDLPSHTPGRRSAQTWSNVGAQGLVGCLRAPCRGTPSCAQDGLCCVATPVGWYVNGDLAMPELLDGLRAREGTWGGRNFEPPSPVVCRINVQRTVYARTWGAQ